MTRRNALALLGTTLARAADRLPANRNVKWGLGSNLWNYFPRVPFTDILDVMNDTGFIGMRLTQFPQILKTYDITAAQMQKEACKRGVPRSSPSPSTAPPTIPRGAPAVVANARDAMTFPEGASAPTTWWSSRPNRSNGATPALSRPCASASTKSARPPAKMGFRAGLHNHMGQMVQTPDEIDRCMAMTDPKTLLLLAGHGAPAPGRMRRREDAGEIQEPPDAGRLQRRQACRNAKPDTFDRETIFDLGDGDIDFPACHRVLKSHRIQGLADRRSRYRAPGAARQLRALRRIRGQQSWSRSMSDCLAAHVSGERPLRAPWSAWTTASSIRTCTSGSTIRSFRSRRERTCPIAMPRRRCCST